MNTTEITIGVTSIIQGKGGNKNQVRLNLENPGVRDPEPTAFSAIGCCDTRKNFDELETVLSRWTRNDGKKNFDAALTDELTAEPFKNFVPKFTKNKVLVHVLLTNTMIL